VRLVVGAMAAATATHSLCQFSLLWHERCVLVQENIGAKIT
jgi:hypothetical protein